MQAFVTVYLDQRDITGRVVSARVSQQPNTIYLEWEITLAGQVTVPATAGVDIYASTDPAIPRAEILVRAGVIPPDRQPEVYVGPDGDRRTRIAGYDRVWLLQRKTPSSTLVLASSWKAAGRAVDAYDGTIGGYRVVRANTVGSAVRALARLGGVDARWAVGLDPQLRPIVIDPSWTYWQAIVNLARPFAPQTYYWQTSNTLVFLGSEARRMGWGGTLDLGDSVTKIVSTPQPYRNLRRIVMRFAP